MRTPLPRCRACGGTPDAHDPNEQRAYQLASGVEPCPAFVLDSPYMGSEPAETEKAADGSFSPTEISA